VPRILNTKEVPATYVEKSCRNMYLLFVTDDKKSQGGLVIKRNIMTTTPLYTAQVIIPKQQDISITAAVAMITINQNTTKD
jgi:hypothetical protein